MTAFAAGGLAGAAVAWLLVTLDLARERGTVPVLLAAIAVFYPVFALDAGGGGQIAAHASLAGAFVVLAVLATRVGPWLAAFGIVVHGLLDAALHALPAPGPAWWPPFCGGLDLVLGGLLIWHLRHPSSRVRRGEQA